MCNVLNDIAMAQDMLEAKAEEQEEEEEKAELPPHPADEKYANLMANLKIIPPNEEEYKIIDKYCQVGGIALTSKQPGYVTDNETLQTSHTTITSTVISTLIAQLW